jgi:hypothetical protein
VRYRGITRIAIICESKLSLQSLTIRLKLYVHDYLTKNGFTSAAAQFHTEAQLGDQHVPMNVAGGALTE